MEQRDCCCHADIAKRDAEISRLKADLAFVSARRDAASEISERWIANYLELSRQHRHILTLLEYGPQTNVDLSDVALRYSARIHELRAAGYDITKERGTGGVFVYTLRKASQ